MLHPTPAYPKLDLFIDGAHVAGGGAGEPVLDPSTETVIGHVPHADIGDLDRAAEAADRAFASWSRTAPGERSRILRKAADILRARAASIGPILTLEQGKPVAEAIGEIQRSADQIDWMAEEARRMYGRVIPAPTGDMTWTVTKEAIGPAAGFTPWNFPVSQAVRKIAAALAAGCTLVLKPSEETPASAWALADVFAEAGTPKGVLNVVFGVPAQVSSHLIAHPAIQKMSFTGSVPVGRELAALASRHLKRSTLELGGHSPVIVDHDADADAAVALTAATKFRNAGQICVAPSRFYVHRSQYDRFVAKYVETAKNWRVGNPFESTTQMGPMANPRRITAMEGFVADAVETGASLEAGGRRMGNQGFFFEPTVLAEVPKAARIMREEPFGPIASIVRFDDLADAVKEANGLPYGLAAYAFTRSQETARKLSASLKAGMVAINQPGFGSPETPFGGIRNSGWGSEGGTEGLDAYTVIKFVTHKSL